MGDTVWDIQAAAKLGLKVVAVVTGGICRHELEEAGAIAVYDDVAHLLAELDRLPHRPPASGADHDVDHVEVLTRGHERRVDPGRGQARTTDGITCSSR